MTRPVNREECLREFGPQLAALAEASGIFIRSFVRGTDEEVLDAAHDVSERLGLLLESGGLPTIALDGPDGRDVSSARGHRPSTIRSDDG